MSQSTEFYWLKAHLNAFANKDDMTMEKMKIA